MMREAWVWISWMNGSGVIEMGLIGVKERMWTAWENGGVESMDWMQEASEKWV